METPIWWCGNCGYERHRSGVCEACGDSLLRSPLPELPEGGQELSYDIDEDWDNADRVELIDQVINATIRHRFPHDDLLIIAAEDEPIMERVLDEVLAAPTRTVKEFTLRDLIVLDGLGWAPLAGEKINLVVYNDHLQLGDAHIPLANLRDVRVEGKSVVKGGGFLGGGFGVTGAAEGMLIAGLLNAATTKHKTWVIITMVAVDGEVALRWNDVNETDARAALRPLAEAAYNARQPIEGTDGPSTSMETDDLVAQLERLGKLKEAGLLDDEEFLLAKRRLLS